ncbi:MAG: GNAT family N-acetyltransferase [Candidatus Hodarchaeales archaeon]|jgi:predicted acetyltransferase
MICRLATNNDKEAIRKIRVYAFAGRKNRYDQPKSPDAMPLVIYPMTDYVVEENNRITAVIGVIDFSQRIRGAWVKMAGISAVACKPEYRRKHHITKLFDFLFQDIHKKGYLVSSLYPFSYAFYEKVGYAHVDSLDVYSIRCANVNQKPTPNRCIEEDYHPEYIRCHPLYQKMTNKIDGLVKRPPSIWKELMGWSWNSRGFQFFCQDLNGKDLGYIILRFEQKSHQNKYPFIEVREMVSFDPETKQALLNFLANHDSQRKYFKFAPFDSNYLLYVKSPDIKEKRHLSNSMFRVIDLEKLLPNLSYSDEISETLSFTITDSKCPWNNKSFELQVKDGQGRVMILQQESKFQLTVNALNQIIFGFYSPSELAEAGKITGTQAELSILSHIFPKQSATLRDFF